MSNLVLLDGHSLSLDEVGRVSRREAEVDVSDAVWDRMRRAREVVDRIAAGDEPVYGVNTGFGALAEVPIPKDKVRQLQRNLIVSHAVGVGDPLPLDVARALMLLRANTLAVGHSGCRPMVLEHLQALLNAGCSPFVPKKGSVGASGDLAPLAHVALLLIGEGAAFIEHERVSATEALARAGLEPLVLEAKEGLALINGTQAMCASGILSLLRAERLCRQADVIGAMSLDALKGTNRAFDDRIHQARPHPGQLTVAQNLRSLLEGSELLASHAGCGKVQDPYSLRCMPQVHGATRDALAYVRSVLEREINSATDNPLVFLKGDGGVDLDEIISGGNFHGQPVAIALDVAAIGLAELANIAERRVEQLVNPALSSGLPPFLAPDPGLNSGFMILQVTAASLINENKILCHPASVDSIPSSANREDHVSMGMTAANKLAHVVDNVRRVLGVELLCAAQAIDLREGLKSGPGLDGAYRAVREVVTFADCDRPFAHDCEVIDNLMDSDRLVDAVKTAGTDVR